MTGAALQTPPATRPRVAFLDSLRFVAAGAVLLQHAAEQQHGWGERLVATLSPGVFGVVLFFLISGFVIPMSVGRDFTIGRFVVRRLLRIYPLVLVAFAIAALCGWATDWPVFHETRVATARDWIANLLLAQDYVGALPIHGVTWTLSLELAWYTLFAILHLWRRERFETMLLIALPAVLLAAAATSLAVDHRLPLARAGMIYAAALGAQAFRYHQGAVTARVLLAEAGLFLAVMAACNAVSFGHFRHPNISLDEALIPWAIAPVLFLGVVMRPGIARWLDRGWLAWLGAISFSTYLLHPFALAFAEAWAPGPAALPLGLVLTLALSVAGYRLVELPAMRWSKRLTRPQPMALPPAAP